MKEKVCKEKYILAVLLGILCVGYFSIYINKIFPYQEGWYMNYDELIKLGKLPYKDFYFYLPPLDLITNHIMLFMSNGFFLVYKFFRLFERVFLIEIMYFTLSRYYKPRYAWFASLVGGILGASQSFELMGDYNQTGQLLFVILAYTSARFAESMELKIQKKWIFICGFIIGLQFTLKQTYFVSAVIVYFVILTLMCAIEKNKNYLKYCLYTFLGICIPVSICFAWTIKNNCLVEFLEQVYFTDAKGGIFDVLLYSIVALIKKNFGYICLALLIFILLVFLWENKNNKQNLWKNKYFIFYIFAIIANCGYLFYSCITGLMTSYFESDFIIPFSLLAIILAIFFVFSDKIIKKTGEKPLEYLKIFLIVFSFVMIGILFASNYHEVSGWVFENTSAFSLVHHGAPIVLFLGAFISTIFLICYYQKIKTGLINKPILMILSSALAVCYASLMTARDYIVSSTCWITAPIILTIILGIKIKYSKVKNYCIIILCFVICSTCLAQKVICAYSWWGWVDEPIYEKKYSVDIKKLKGYKFSEKEKKLYEETIKIINSNTDKDSTILGFPHIVLFNVLTDHIKTDWSVPVLFYDVCSDEYAKKATKEIQENPPDIMIWSDMPGCMETHEEIFRSGEPLGQREIQDWFINTKEKNYNLVGQIDNLFIYKLKNNGVKEGYTYFDEPDRINITATEEE